MPLQRNPLRVPEPPSVPVFIRAGHPWMAFTIAMSSIVATVTVSLAVIALATTTPSVAASTVGSAVKAFIH